MKKAIIRIDIEDFLTKSQSPEIFGYIDASTVSRDPNEIIDSDSDSDRDCIVHVTIDHSDVVLSYLYEPGKEDFEIKESEFKSVRFWCTNDFFSPGCFDKLLQELNKK